MPEPNIQSAYLRALLAARQRGLALTRATKERIDRAMEVAIRELTKDAETGRITPARASAMRQQVRGLLSAFQQEFASATDAAVRFTASDVSRIHRAVNVALFKQGGLEIGRSILARFDVIPTQAVAAIMSRAANAATFRTVALRKLEALVPEMDAMIDAAVTRGVGVGRFTMDLADLMANGDPDLFARLPRGLSSRLHRGVGQIDLARYGLDPDEMKETRSMLYDARRIAVSETNNTLREAGARSLQTSPLILAAKWQRSGRHHVLDECDALAGLDMHGYGPGMFPVDAWPFAPHPHCACTQGGPLLTRPLREWKQPKPPSRPVERDARDPGVYPQEWRDQWSKKRFARVRANMASLVGVPPA
jgi:hypothetical protein